MLISLNKYNLLSIFIIIIIVSSFAFTPPVFSQPKEFLRLRSTPQGTIPTTESMTEEGVEVEYYIAPGDTIEVYLWGNADLTREVTIRGDGKMSYPLIGTFEAAGLSLDQLQEVITKKMAEYIRTPQVIVSLKSSAGNKIIVLGQVGYPGIFAFKGSITLLDAIAMAGDFTNDARKSSVMIISDNFTMNPKVRKVDAITAIRSGFVGKDMVLKPNDVIYVPRSTIADFNLFLNDIAPTINTVSNIFGLGSTISGTMREGRAWFMHRTVKVINSN